MFPAGNQAEHLSLYLDGSNHDAAGPGAAQGWMRAAKFSLSVVNQLDGANSCIRGAAPALSPPHTRHAGADARGLTRTARSPFLSPPPRQRRSTSSTPTRSTGASGSSSTWTPSTT